MNDINDYNQIINKISSLENDQRQILLRLKKLDKLDVNLDVIEKLLRLLVSII